MVIYQRFTSKCAIHQEHQSRPAVKYDFSLQVARIYMYRSCAYKCKCDTVQSNPISSVSESSGQHVS